MVGVTGSLVWSEIHMRMVAVVLFMASIMYAYRETPRATGQEGGRFFHVSSQISDCVNC